jgi:hypothetical protein
LLAHFLPDEGVCRCERNPSCDATDAALGHLLCKTSDFRDVRNSAHSRQDTAIFQASTPSLSRAALASDLCKAPGSERGCYLPLGLSILPDRAERLPKLLREDLRLLEGCEMASVVYLVPVDDVRP